MTLCDRCHKKVERGKYRDDPNRQEGVFSIPNPLLSSEPPVRHQEAAMEMVEVCKSCYDLYMKAKEQAEEKVNDLYNERYRQMFTNWLYGYKGGGVAND